MVPNFLQSAIEQGWDVTRLNDLIKSKAILGHLDGNHGNLYPRNSEFVDSGIKYISANALIDGSVDLSKSKYLTAERGSQFKKGVAKDGDVLFAHNATVGPVALLNTKDEYVILSTSLTYYRCNLTKVDNHYLVQYMSSPAFTRQYERIMKQTTRNQLPITAQRDFYFVLPKLPEQRKIAKILSTWDKAISTTERLIDNSKQQKKALMQQLLTGKKRLLDDSGKPFEGEWEDACLGDLELDISDGNYSAKYPKQSDFLDSGIPFLRANNLKKGTVSDDDMRYISIEQHNVITKGHLKKGDILLSTRGELGNVALVPNRHIGSNINAQLVRINTGNKLNGKFLFQLLDYSRVMGKFESLSTGTALKQLPIGKLKKLEFKLPLLKEEQQKIASVLNNADQETVLLEQQLADLKQEKKALMQQLLTGKRRVKLDDKEVA